MQKYIPLLSVFMLGIVLAACSSLQFPGVYKIPIEQGNVITQEMVDQLKPGMSSEQVEYIMGSPLVKDSFNAERWDYVYSIQRGDKKRKQYRLTIYFENDALKYFTGDFIPSPINSKGAGNDESVDEDAAQNNEGTQAL
jgi:outer membrane protein assembly factor BamE